MKYLIVLISFVVILACNKTTSQNNESNPNVTNQNVTEAQYPHEKNFFKSHGTTYLSNKEQCLGCHGKDGTGGTAKVSCVQCHEVYPHVNFLGVPDQHAASYAKNPQSCSRCHGDDWSGGKVGVSCLKCHENFPHPKKWASPENHGKAFVAIKDQAQCLTCHDSNNPKSIATNCNTCHIAYPHDAKFKTGSKLHKQLAMTYDGKCLSCHRDYKENMPNNQDADEGIGCMSCHSGAIEIHWLEPTAPQAPQGSTGMLLKNKKRIPSSSPHQKIKMNKTPNKIINE